MSDEHRCGFDGDSFACIEGRVYGPCEHEACGGVCEYCGDCKCECHDADRDDARQPANTDREDADRG